jgi:hypothetical protein
MIETPVRTSRAADAEDLRAQLARSDALAGTVLPILRHLVSNESGAVFGDEVIARVRAMMVQLTGELLAVVRSGAQEPGIDRSEEDKLFAALLTTPDLLAHLHAQALEWALTARLEARCGVDPVIPPLLQERIASPKAAVHSPAARLLAAQAQWCQAQRRMTITLDALPGEALHATLLAMRSALQGHAGVDHAQAQIRAAYDEGATRLGLVARLVSELPDDGAAALELEYAGAALFITALSLRAGQPRDDVSLSLHQPHLTRLALTLISAGLTPSAAERQIALVHEQAQLAPVYDAIRPQEAADILHHAQSVGG